MIKVLMTAIVISGALTVYFALSQSEPVIEIGTFSVLLLTLVAILIYVRDTHRIADVTHSRWMKDSVLSATYGLQVRSKSDFPRGRTMFKISNQSSLLIRVKVVCKFRVYGEEVHLNVEYDGTKTWLVYPLQASIGWFEIEMLCGRKGKTVDQMAAERTDDNRSHQLQMDLTVHFRDELGNKRSLPTRNYFFDFADWSWIPALTLQDGWDVANT
ncbi:MAG: hypothetical protein KAT58_05120 [candidate division Zixibacteria bacterium]|nr:hypothetical protein [candidate division Zixibacteria bacterium]